MIPYLRTLDAHAEGTAWEEVARIFLHIDPEHEPARAKRAYESHLARAKRMAHMRRATSRGRSRPARTGRRRCRRDDRATASYRMFVSAAPLQNCCARRASNSRRHASPKLRRMSADPLSNI